MVIAVANFEHHTIVRVDCTHALALLSSRSSIFNRLNDSGRRVASFIADCVSDTQGRSERDASCARSHEAQATFRSERILSRN